MKGATDWDAYYAQPAWPSHLTRPITTRLLLSLMKTHAGSPQSICELGGANSCFIDAVRAAYPGAEYTVVDSNAAGLRMLEKRMEGTHGVRLRQQDIRHLPDDVVSADLVFSVGLVEHFDHGDTARVIAKHFRVLKPGGLAIITFPTPTWLYRGTRRLAELAGVWKFPDERPLQFSEVTSTVAAYADILQTLINWRIVLTQGVVVARRH